MEIHYKVKLTKVFFTVRGFSFFVLSSVIKNLIHHTTHSFFSFIHLTNFNLDICIYNYSDWCVNNDKCIHTLF